jgi:hypothetical protein
VAWAGRTVLVLVLVVLVLVLVLRVRMKTLPWLTWMRLG